MDAVAALILHSFSKPTANVEIRLYVTDKHEEKLLAQTKVPLGSLDGDGSYLTCIPAIYADHFDSQSLLDVSRVIELLGKGPRYDFQAYHSH